MARDTITARFQLQANFETIQAIRRTLADETAQAGWISLLSETVTRRLARQVEGDFELTVALKVPSVRRTRRGARLPTPKVEHGILSSFTAVKEDRRGRSVWYAHRRRAGQLKRLYLGKSENLTAAKLVEAARKLNA
jgi:hypothetical protein